MYYDEAIKYCHLQGFKVNKIQEFLESQGIHTNEQTILNMFKCYMVRTYLNGDS